MNHDEDAMKRDACRENRRARGQRTSAFDLFAFDLSVSIQAFSVFICGKVLVL
jgi:hypothetical protein